MTVFTAPFSAVAISAAQDVWELLPDATTRIRILEIEIAQYSDPFLHVDLSAEEIELIPITFHRGHTTSGSGGGTITPANLNSYGRASVTAVERNNTTVATTSGELIYAGVWHNQAGFIWRQPEDVARDPYRRHIVIAPEERFVVRIGGPLDSLTCNGTLMFEELGKSPVS